MKTLRLYLLRETLATLAMTVVVFTGILLLGNVLKDVLVLVVSQKASLPVVAKAVGMLIPYVLAFSLPMGLLCASLLVFNAAMPTERLNIADTVKVQWGAYLSSGSLLLSDMGRVLASIEQDEAATHDAFCGASNEASNRRHYGDGRNSGAFPNARDRLLLGAAKHGLGRRDVHPCINLFKGVRIGADGSVTADLGPFAPGRSLVLRAEMDLIVVIANCPHVLDPRPWSATPLRATAWRGPVTAEDDPIRTATPERLRAFLNTEDLYRR
jgi:urea carboxylase-associated protein 2